MNETDLQRQIAELQAQLAPIQEQIAPLQEQLRDLNELRKKAALARIEEIQLEIRRLLDEAEEASKFTGLYFYRETFIQGIDGSYERYGGEQYWQASEYC